MQVERDMFISIPIHSQGKRGNLTSRSPGEEYRSPKWACLCIVLLAVLVLNTSRASAAIYWTGFGIGAANQDGSALHATLPSGALPGPIDMSGACGVTVDASHLYWNNISHGSIHRANLDGTEPQVVVPDEGDTEATCGIAIDGSHIYWPENSGKAIARSNLNGSELDRGFVTGTKSLNGLAVGDGRLYWSDWSAESIGRANIDGTEVEPEIVSKIEGLSGVAVGGGHLYWSNFLGPIGRANIDGSEADPGFITGGSRPCGVAVDGAHIYWPNEDSADDGIGRANLDGSSVTQHFMQPPGNMGCGIALDSRVFVPPVTDFSIDRIVHDRKNGTVTVALTLPGRGFLNIRGQGIAWKPVSPPGLNSDGAIPQGGPIRLRAWLVKGGRQRKQLRRSGAVSGSLEISFRVVTVDSFVWLDQLSTTKSKTVKFIRRRPFRSRGDKGTHKPPHGNRGTHRKLNKASQGRRGQN